MSESLDVTPRPPARALGLVLVVCCLLAGAVFALALPAATLAEACPNEAFRVGPSASLPDCRAYELVTPAYKEGFVVNLGRLAEDGSSVSGGSFGTFAGLEGSAPLSINGNLTSLGARYVLTREASGWTAEPITLPQSLFPLALPADESSDLGSSLWLASSLSQAPRRPFSPYTVLADFRVREPDGAIVDVGPLYAPSTDPELLGEVDFNYDGASSDLSHILFTMFNNHWPGDATPNGPPETGDLGGFEHPSLYEYAGTGNTAPTLVGVSGGLGSTSLISECGTEVGPPRENNGLPSRDRWRNSISTTAAIVFFTALECGSSPAVNELYARIDGGEVTAHTVAISEPSPADCAACDIEAGVLAGATFQGASADGSKVFFTTRQPLLGEDTSENLYEYDFDSPAGQRVIRVSAGDGTLPVPQAGVASVPIVSNDGSHVYFVATGALTSTPNSLGQSAQAGADNLYLFERDAQYPAGRIAFIAGLSAGDGLLAGTGSASASLEGRFLVFLSSVDLTPDDTSVGVRQAFEYDAQTGDLVRVSIGHEGYNANGNGGQPVLAARVPENSSPTNAASGLSVADDGAVFFTSADSLVPQAVSGVSNVYEYENGDVHLISDGHDTFGAELLFVDASGANVFFTTHDQLTGQDGDTQTDTYDARVNGGFPAPASSSACEGDACQGQLSAAPVLLAPGSESQVGGGNLPPAASQPVAVVKPKAKKRKGKIRRRSGAAKRRSRAAARRVVEAGANRGGRS